MRLPNLTGNAHAVIFGLAGLEVDLRELGGYHSHSCKITKDLRRVTENNDLMTVSTMTVIPEVRSDVRRGSRDGPSCLLPGCKIQL